MPIKVRLHPAIPDHEVLRKIGGGAYGEVWLARGVTGALRAVKVVWREDFEDERGFEREFEGILKFEPMSRDHPALVNILHVGRSPDGVSFYYYVMELGDDLTSGQNINPIEYEARTLRADNQQGAGVQWATNDCIDVGLRLAEALEHLHERGLAHRDVKPSNVIFVNGKAKLADIGLVAARGQRTFVGTEGFVPPEGPGTAQADVYSLGKVLYEIATGKDRFLFPELPDSIPSGADGKCWLELNKIICDICDPRISKRKISSAADLADTLRRLQRGKRRRTNSAVWMTTAALFGFTLWASFIILKNHTWFKGTESNFQEEAPPKIGMMRIGSTPEGAEVSDASGNLIGMTPTELIEARVGDDYLFTIKKSGYRPLTLQGKIPATVVTEPLLISDGLENFSPPQVGVKWQDHLGILYEATGQGHESGRCVKKAEWLKFTRSIKDLKSTAEFLNYSQTGKPGEIVIATPHEARAFCAWFQEGGKKDGFLTNDHQVIPIFDIEFNHLGTSNRGHNQDLKPFQLLVRQIPYGEIRITTQPSGVEVYLGTSADPQSRILAGIANNTLVIHKVRPANWQLYLVREGYQPLKIDIEVGESEKVEQAVIMKKSLGVIFGKPWKNGVDMCFAPIGQELMASIWETRVQDYELFIKETRQGAPPPVPDFIQTPEHPVVNVSREDAQAFCIWLTERERQAERIAQTHIYRLLTDLEWSKMAGIDEEEGISPSWRYARKQMVYPWGDTWPPQTAIGNFADTTIANLPGFPLDRTIPDYNDGFANTAPVGSFPANSNGIFDISGNAQEWVGDDYSKLGKSPLGVLRGGCWNTYQSENLITGFRNPQPPNFRDSIYSFRVVLAKVPPNPE